MITVVPATPVQVLSGTGDPEGVVVSTWPGQLYVDLSTSTIYKFTGTVGTSTGWS
jgi:hypothetical protein